MIKISISYTWELDKRFHFCVDKITVRLPVYHLCFVMIHIGGKPFLWCGGEDVSSFLKEKSLIRLSHVISDDAMLSYMQYCGCKRTKAHCRTADTWAGKENTPTHKLL